MRFGFECSLYLSGSRWRMLSPLVVATLLLSGSALLSASDPIDEAFDDFVRTHAKHYSSEIERQHRREVFAAVSTPLSPYDTRMQPWARRVAQAHALLGRISSMCAASTKRIPAVPTASLASLI